MYSGPLWTVEVSSGNDVSGSGANESKFASIQVAINFASDGDSVSVLPGTYIENIDFRGRNIKVAGSQSNTGLNPVIDGNQNGSCVQFTSGETNDAVLSNFTITNGTGTDIGYTVGGGIFSINSSPTLKNLFVTGNSAVEGGGIGIHSGGESPVLDNVIISGNQGGEVGGLTLKSASSTVRNSKIISNTAESSQAGGISTMGGPHDLYNVLIADNALTDNNTNSNAVGGIQISNSGTVNLVNVTITKNDDGVDGEGNGGILLRNGVQVNIFNSILWENNGEEISLQAGSDEIEKLHVYHSNIQGGFEDSEQIDLVWGTGNIDSDPVFVDPINSNYHLSDLSPCISAGLTSITTDEGMTLTVLNEDLEGGLRPNPIGSAPDMGAFESDKGVDPDFSRPNWFVNGPASLPYGNGGPGAPFSTINQAIDIANNGDTIRVLTGTYVENLNLNGKGIAIIGENYETTIIDGDSSGIVLTLNNSSSSSLVENITIQNGSGGIGTSNGAGIYCDGCVSTLRNVYIKENFQDQLGDGSGIYAINGDLYLDSVNNSNNEGSFGSIAVFNSILSIEDSEINNNLGGGLYVFSSDVSMSNTILNNNTSTNFNAGGIYSLNSSFDLEDVTVSNNTASANDPESESVGGLFMKKDNDALNDFLVRIRNSNIINNTGLGTYGTGGMYFFAMDSVVISNSTITGNSGMGTGGVNTNQVGYLQVNKSLIAGNTGQLYGGLSLLATGQQNPAQIINSTIADNVFNDPNSEGKTAGLILERGSYAYLLNSIIYSEQFPIVTLGNYDIEGPAELTVSYSLIYEDKTA